MYDISDDVHPEATINEMSDDLNEDVMKADIIPELDDL